MVAMNHQRIIWSLNRAYLRHGPLMLAACVAIAATLYVGIAVAASALRMAKAENAIQARTSVSKAEPVRSSDHGDSPMLQLPQAAQRFQINRRVLVALDKTGFVPDQIRFKFESADEAGLTRQIAVFTVKARWDDVAKLLAQLQQADRAIYISKLRVSRESAEDPLVAAEVQLAVALLEPAPVAGGAP